MSGLNIDDRIDLRLLRYFEVVAEELHFGKAARRLGIAQPPLSQQIKRLEFLLGVQLFARTSRSVALTDAGTVLLTASRRAIRDLGNGVVDAQAMASGQRGRLTVGYVGLAMTSFLPALVRRFHANYPEIRLTLRGDATSLQLAALKSGAIDVAFATDISESDSIVEQARWTEPLVILEPKHVAIGAATLQLVMFPRHQAQALYDKIMSIVRGLARDTMVVQEAESWYSIGSLVASGLGFTVAPEGIRRYRIPGLRYTPLAKRMPKVSLSLLTRTGQAAPHLQAFVDEARRWTSPRLNTDAG